MITKIQANNKRVTLEKFNFPAGETQIRLKDLPDDIVTWIITLDYRNDADLIELALVINAARLISDAPFDIVMPYLPYSRQDRAINQGEAFSLQAILGIIKGMNIRSLITWDVHSPVAQEIFGPQLLNIRATEFLRDQTRKEDCIVAPDAGAQTRAQEVANLTGSKMIRCSKKRDPMTGRLTDPEILDDIDPNADLLIVDDICDGGRTFLQLGKILKQKTKGKIKLYVTHGIFSAGFDDLLSIFDEIIVANCFVENPPANVKVLRRFP